MNNNIKFAVVIEIVKAASINGETFRAETAEIVLFETAKEALAAFEAAETAAALVVISADMTKEVLADLGLVKVAGWPWYQGQEEGVEYWEGRSKWYHQNPMTWTMQKGSISSESWRKGFVALMRAAW